jgi:hypothetical protein
MAFDAEIGASHIEHVVHSWEELQRALERRYCGARWVFRGQRDAGWPLKTSIERVCAHIPPGKWKRAEEHLLRQFQRRLHQYQPLIPEMDDTHERLALMQHHGTPTRLLDWTRSPYIAAYFAVEAASSDAPSCVWIINRQAMHNATLNRTPDLLQAITLSRTEALSDKAVFNGFLFNSNTPSVVAVEPFRMNERLTVQQGLFLLPTEVRESFVANLNAPDPAGSSPDSHLERIVMKLEYGDRLRVLEELAKMNVTRASLFPGIDGFAQSLATEIEIWGGFDDQRLMLDGSYIEYF